jgi:hypothetical protein
MRPNKKMINAQVSMINECKNAQCLNALNHCSIDYSLTLEHCLLNIAAPKGVCSA